MNELNENIELIELSFLKYKLKNNLEEFLKSLSINQNCLLVDDVKKFINDNPSLIFNIINLLVNYDDDDEFYRNNFYIEDLTVKNNLRSIQLDNWNTTTYRKRKSGLLTNELFTVYEKKYFKDFLEFTEIIIEISYSYNFLIIKNFMEKPKKNKNRFWLCF